MKGNYTFQKNQWFFERTIPGLPAEVKTGLKIKKKIFSGKSPYQKIEIFDTFFFGRILVLDGIIQLSQADEFIYHEMLVQPAMFSHFAPKKVLIIGGGDGGALREVLKHPIEKAYLVEIDKKVIEISKKYLPFVSRGAFSQKRAKIIFGDGKKFIKDYKNFFDLIIVDSTDPFGISLSLFSKKFYQDAFLALKKNGILSVQSGCLLEQFSHFRNIYQKLKEIFPFVRIHQACIPSLQCSSEYGFILAAKKDLKEKKEEIEKKYKKLKLDLKYYSPEIHFSSQILAKYLKEKLE